MVDHVVSPAKASVVQYARELGFDLVCIASAEPLAEHGRAAQERVRQGYMDGMPWFTEERVGCAGDPQALLPGARAIIVVPSVIYHLKKTPRIPNNPLAKWPAMPGGRTTTW